MKRKSKAPAPPPSPPVPPPAVVPLSVPEVAKRLNLSLNSVYGHVRAGHIPVIRLGNKMLVRSDVIEAILGSGLPRAAPDPDPLT